MRFIVRILANALAIYLAAFFVPGVSADGDWKLFLIAGVALSLINTFIRPVLKIISLPLIILTFGFFSIVINILTIWLLTRFIPELIISGVVAYFFTSLIVSLVNWTFDFIFKKSSA